MEDKKPLLSICIPTYNRAECLDKCIASIVSQVEFNSKNIELVISDNASTDNTEEIVKKYQKKYQNIFYSKNEKNNTDKNFPTVIGKAHGIFRKLCNDTLIFSNGSIKHILKIINENLKKRPVLFFMNHNNKKRWKKFYTTDCFDAFVKIISFHSTWIGCFGIWEDDFEKIENKVDGCELHLWQTKVLFEIVERKKTTIVDNVRLFSTQEVQKKIDYGQYQVFYENYLGLYQQYLALRVLSKNVFEYIKKHLLLDFFSVSIANFYLYHDKYDYSSENDDYRKLISNAYHHEMYYWYYCLKLRFRIIILNIKNLKNIETSKDNS